MKPYQVLPVWMKVDLGVMAMKGYSILPGDPEGDLFSTLLFIITTMMLNYTIRKCKGGYKFIKSQEK